MLSTELKRDLKEVADLLVSRGKGILAADEPIDYMESILSPIGLKNNEEHRHQYRQILFSCNDINNYISGVILHPETISRATNDGILFLDLLRSKKILPGVNVDGGLTVLEGTSGETITKGLDDLDERCKKFKKAGCCFAKWRCAFKIGLNTPSMLAIKANANTLARYSAICQANGLVPIVEPEVQLEGDHDLERAQLVSELVLSHVYRTLCDFGIYLEGTILKPSMVMPGCSCKEKVSGEQLAKATVEVFSRTVPAAMPGIGFLSGGQTAQEAKENLKLINQHKGKMPWALTFIFGRALQESVASVWCGKKENIVKAQTIFLQRAKANSEASLGL